MSFSLSKNRKKRPVPAGWVTSDEISAFEAAATTALPAQQTTSLDSSEDYAAVGGLAGDAVIYSVDADKAERQLAVNEPITSTLWTGSKVLFGTGKGSVKVFENGAEVGALSEHSGATTSLSAHPSGDLIASVGADKSIVLYDLTTMKRVSRAYADAGKDSITSTLRFVNKLTISQPLRLARSTPTDTCWLRAQPRAISSCT